MEASDKSEGDAKEKNHPLINIKGDISTLAKGDIFILA